MKKLLLGAAVIAAMSISSNANAQLVDEANVTITMDLQPILQLNMTGPSNIDFVFDQISEYVGGITQYGATSLQVSSTVSWDLYAVGFSSTGATNWDQQVIYGGGADPNAFDIIPIELLELRQDKANPFPGLATAFDDYNAAFVISPVTTGSNNIYASATPYVAPANGQKYIAGGNAAVLTAFVPGGSYLVAQAGVYGSGSNYYYTIDYRIVPGLPAIFPNAATNAGVDLDLVTVNGAGAYAQPGVYTMNVKYVLAENQ
ncbi:MAG: hypothetical protein H0W84_07610 [Bacteroidetes bacterium]|nr:hypothetical protein [Bacteroidota bacterium]